ncbi:MAG: Flp1 family type IVb pilin [Eubacteriales bacterium]|nr:Flp1 family type IVb pilin [Eubacteriales bacterium]
MWKLRIRGFFHELRKDKKGIGTVEMILILVVLIGLVIIFKSQLTSLVNSIFKKIVSQSNGI